MPTNNAIDLSATGICKYDGAGTFSATSTTLHSVLIGAASNAINNLALTNGQLAIGSTGADPVASTLSAGAGIAITNGAGSISIAATGGGLTWSAVTTATAMVANNGYGANGSGTLAFTLPASAALGSVFYIIGMAHGWTIAENTGQQIFFGNTSTTVTSGSLASTNAGDCVAIVCLVADTTFYVFDSIGNITVT